ncbi:flagellar filament capping protein FliD [Haloimpatiens sp. FM7330]|uniref:flagellar filament capping protein FliD n=1 Tax=Haloimpatiens sp. FM7330 TaxID=3298610 RepID=UPI00363EA854
MGEAGGISTSNVMRFTGLATGMDTDAMVKKMMAAENIKVEKQKQAKQMLEWKQEAYVGIIKDTKAFNSEFLDILSDADTNMMKSSGYSTSKITSSNENIASATACAGAANGTYKIKVGQIAENAKVQSNDLNSIIPNNIITDKITTGNATEWNDKKLKFELSDGTTKEITISGINDTDTVSDIGSKIQGIINSDVDLAKEITVSDTADGRLKFEALSSDKVTIQDSGNMPPQLANLKDKSILSLSTNTKLSNLGITANSEIKITANGKEFNVKIGADDTLNNFMNNISGAKITEDKKTDSLGNYVTVHYSELTKKLTIETRETGERASLKIEDVTGNIASTLGINKEDQGQNAKVQITPPGEATPVTVEKSSNAFTIDNIQYDLRDKQADVLNSDGTFKDTTEAITLNVTSDTSKTVDKIKKFVEKYNELIDKVNKKISEKKNYKYKPLTAEQKKGMEKDEIKKWDEKVKQGILRNDNYLDGMVSRMRSAFYDSVEDSGISLTEMGLSTSRIYSKKGKIEIDEEKLKKALETRGDQIVDLFTKTSSASDKTTRYKEEGVLSRLKDIINDYTGSEGSLIKKAGYTDTRWVTSNDLSKSIKKYEKTIKDMDKKLYRKQEHYYQMFAKLETYMNNMNAQSNWLYSQLGMGQ